MTPFNVVALALTALALVPSAAHLFELPGKIDMTRDEYFAVQTIYAGWSLFAVPIFGAIAANAALWFGQWRSGEPSAHWAAVSATLIAISLAIFFVWVFPGNTATQNWTVPTANWEALRRQWEYGHAANALIVFAALIATSIAATGRAPVTGTERE